MRPPSLLLRTILLGLTAATEASPVRDTAPDTWVGADALHRVLPTQAEVGPPQAGRTVGIFYLNWHADFKAREVYDIAKMLAANPESPAWGPEQAPHYWGEPRLGYYRPDDPWVIRKHMQMLTDAGVDVLILDATNGLTYDAEREALCRVLIDMKAEGRRVPQFAMFAYANHVPTVTHLWETLYRPGRYSEHWFRWQGKPLLLTPTTGLPAEVTGFFTIRTSWAWTRGQPWFGDGKDRWPWLDSAPQVPGWHDHPGEAEAMPVGVSQHPTTNIGRSFHGGRQPEPSATRPAEGLYFDEQWRHALPLSPKFILVAGWNEWIAQRFVSDGNTGFKGGRLPKGRTFFVDLYDAEFSRDIEPMQGGFGDNYYYQLAANIRRYKGARPTPTARGPASIAIPGDFMQWTGVEPTYLDDLGDVDHREHDGVANAGRYINRTGRNDIDTLKVAQDGQALYFYASTARALTSTEDRDWMVLLLDMDRDSRTGRLGYDYRINHRRPSATSATIERWDGHGWVEQGVARLQVGPRELHLAVPKESLGLPASPVGFDFKWTDNIPDSGDGMVFLDQGDAAPNARFNYRHAPASPGR